MSIVPFLFSLILAFILVVLFFWWWRIFIFLFFFFGLIALFSLRETKNMINHFSDGFFVFLLTEFMAFVGLFTVIACSQYPEDLSISVSAELPLLGCFLLMGSSITVTAYHYNMGYSRSQVLLMLTMLLGFCFGMMQMVELHDLECDLLDSVYAAACMSTVCMHFSHVFIGLIGLWVVLLWGDSSPQHYYSGVAVWYWHFVDFIWLFVYLMVYIL